MRNVHFGIRGATEQHVQLPGTALPSLCGEDVARTVRLKIHLRIEHIQSTRTTERGLRGLAFVSIVGDLQARVA